ncbi:MAG: hypothetical protein LUO79_07600 [Methanomassiliicoccales archaeon]|nr:hypothetical protein [Methanomassiliicoccales archaeon]
MAEEQILTRHPTGKRGVSISREKYDVIRRTILDCLRSRPLNHMELARCMEARLEGRFEGSIRWYLEVVKLDMEATRTIERVRTTDAQVYRINEGRGKAITRQRTPRPPRPRPPRPRGR